MAMWFLDVIEHGTEVTVKGFGMEVIVHGIEVRGAEVIEHDVCLLFLSAPLESVVWIYCNRRYFRAA